MADEFTPMNALSRLILRRKNELNLSWYDIAKRGGFPSHSAAYALATKKQHRQPPRPETLSRLARALEVPLDVVKAAAADAAGYELREVTTTLEAAEDLRVIAQALEEMSPADRTKLRYLAQAFLAESRANEQARLDAELSEAAKKVPGPKATGQVRPIRRKRT